MNTKLNPITGVFFLIAAVFVEGFLLNVEAKMIFWCEVIGIFIFCKINLLWAVHRGHGIRNQKRFTIRGLTIPILIFLAIISTLLTILFYITFIAEINLFKSTIQNLRTITLAAVTAFVTSIVMWHTYWHDETFFYDVSQIAEYVYSSGGSKESLVNRIKELQELKILREN